MATTVKKDEARDEKVLTKELTITNTLGLHARPAAMFVKLCNTYKAEIWVDKGGERVNGKSIMGLLMLAAACGTKIKVIAQGTDAHEAIKALEVLLQRKFDEE